jgi:hypothetical protein
MLALETSTFIQHTLPFAPRIRENVAEMSRLINAALVDENFCRTLLEDPESAIGAGYNGENFQLSSFEAKFVRNVKAESLVDFAVCWTKYASELFSPAEFIDTKLQVGMQNC